MRMRGIGTAAQHFRDDGTAKVSYPSQEAALDTLRDPDERIVFQAYECELCHHWHIGHRTGRNRRRKARKARMKQWRRHEPDDDD